MVFFIIEPTVTDYFHLMPAADQYSGVNIESQNSLCLLGEVIVVDFPGRPTTFVLVLLVLGR